LATSADSSLTFRGVHLDRATPVAKQEQVVTQQLRAAGERVGAIAAAHGRERDLGGQDDEVRRLPGDRHL
jgi:hypothetical protein